MGSPSQLGFLDLKVRFIRSFSLPAPPTASRRRSARAVAGMAAGLLVLGCGDATGPGDERPQVQIHAGRQFTCALDQQGTAWCWGRNERGQLGDGTFADQGVPRRVDGNHQFKSLGIHGTGWHACGVTEDGTGYCWGRNTWGQLGDGTTDEASRPVPVAGGHRFASISAGAQFSCAVTDEGAGYCWGRGDWGNLGDGRRETGAEPVPVAGGLKFTVLKAGSSSLACGVTTSGQAYCWGLNWRGEVGSTTGEMCNVEPFYLACASTPALVPAFDGRRYVDITPGSYYACAITASGIGVCWGRNDGNQLGSETTEICVGGQGLSDAPCSRAPTAIFGGHRFSVLAASVGHTCGVTEAGRALCWGLNELGQLGNGVFRSRSTFPDLVDGNLTFVTITAGLEHSCGATEANEFYCWGINLFGQIGNPDAKIQEFPILVVQGSG